MTERQRPCEHDWWHVGSGWEFGEDPVEDGRLDWCQKCGALRDCCNNIWEPGAPAPNIHITITSGRA